MTLEAIALHSLDNLDAKLNEALGVINGDPNHQSRWTPYQPRLGRKFYKGLPSSPDSELEL
jgi:3'-5' exoribonuclease